jgi:hypothetical protein
VRKAVPRDEDDGRAPDFSAVRANARLELHEAVCAERYNGILTALEQMAQANVALHARLDTVSNRMWIVITSTCGAAIIGLAVLVFYMLTRGR